MIKPKNILSLTLLFIACNLTTNNASASLRRMGQYTARFASSTKKPVFSNQRLFSSNNSTAHNQSHPEGTQAKIKEYISNLNGTQIAILAGGGLLIMYSISKDVEEYKEYNEREKQTHHYSTRVSC